MASATLLSAVRQFLAGHPPFSQMADADVEFVAGHLELAFYGRDEVLIGPDDGPPAHCFIIKQGLVEGVPPDAGTAMSRAPQPTAQLVHGDVFPVGALLAGRAVESTYRAAGDVFCWLLPKPRFDELLQRSPPFFDFCKHRVRALLDLSQQALQASYLTQATQWRALNAPLNSLLRRAPVVCRADESLRTVFERMEREAVGAMLVVGVTQEGREQVQGIFTRQDVIGRVSLPGVPLEAPIGSVMSAPVITMDAYDTVGDAMLLMAEHRLRHVPVMRAGQLVGIVTERDLFVLQRRSLRQIGDAIRQAGDTAALRSAAHDIRNWSYSLVAQGVSADFITRLISRLNDQLTRRLITLQAQAHGIDLDAVCWLALGSEGREEQTIATDQDNGLIVADQAVGEVPRLLVFAQAVNEALDACGYPLCRGGIMAGNPKWCLSLSQWRALFEGWIERGDPQSLLNASIFFDFRALAGDADLARALREHITPRAAATPRFLKQLSDNALRNGPPASWTGGLVETLFRGEEALVDLKLNGTGPFVDAARLFGLAHGVIATGTVDRFEALAAAGHLPRDETRAWIDTFQFFQSLRLRAQHRRSEARAGSAGQSRDGAGTGSAGQSRGEAGAGSAGQAGGEAEAGSASQSRGAAAAAENPNALDTRELSDLDRRILKEAFRQARRLQQRLALDYPG